MKWIRWVSVLVFALLVIGGALAHPLWGDEAETALFGRNILKCGVPCGWDGTNVMGLNDAVVLNSKLINHTSPWGQYYLVALSFKLFGESDFSARLPFVILSILRLWFLYLVVKKMAGERAGTLALLITSVYIPQILYSFQSRYYAINRMGGVLMFWAVLNLLEVKKKWPKLLFVLGSVIYFYGNYLGFAAYFGAMFVFGLIYHYKEWKKFVMWFLVLTLPILMLTVPWFLWQKPFEGRGSYVIPQINLFEYILTYWELTKQLFARFPVLLTSPVLWLVYKKNRAVWGITAMILIYSFLMVTATIFSKTDTSFVSGRYNTVLFSMFIMLMAIGISYFWKINKLFAVFWLGFCLFGDGLLPKYIKEITNPYPTPDFVVAEYLKTHARDGVTAYVNLDRDHESLLFHLGQKIKFVNRVSLTNARLFPKNRKVLPRYVWGYREEPDWLIFYSKRGEDGTFFTFDYLPMPGGVDMANYEETILPVFFADMSRPEIEMRSFEKIDPVYNDQVFIYHKKTK